MSGSRPTICVNMIVKDEEAVICRCIDSLKDVVDYWVICDTGSTDRTIELARERFGEVPGEVHRTSWVNFGHNRSEAIQLAAGKSDYILIVDADMELRVPDGYAWTLSSDSYLVHYEGELDYAQAMLVRSGLPWRFEGATHEYLTADVDFSQEQLDGPTLIHHTDGGNRSEKFERDVELLRAGLEEQPDNARYLFYLGQSLRDVGEYDEALDCFEKRATLGGFAEEAWYAVYQAARMRELRGDPWDVVKAAYLTAYEARPTRLEPLYHLALHYRQEGNHALGRLFSEPVRHTPYPNDVLFVERDWYRFHLPLEYAICCHWLGDYAESIRANNEILDHADMGADRVEHVVANRRFSLDAVYDRRASRSSASNRIKLIVPFYNPGEFLGRCVASLQSQDYDDFEVIFVDDASTDGSHRQIPVDDPRVSLRRNKLQVGLGQNIHTSILNHCAADDIVVMLDGDDWLTVDDALSHIDDCYRRWDCWVMYGQFSWPDGRYGAAQP
ncbi:MAG: glycosyltransferase, partial [Gaiellaceae bacterium]